MNSMKKTIFKIVLLVVLSCLSSIWIYYNIDETKSPNINNDTKQAVLN